MTNNIPLFEAKAHLSAIVRRVAENGQDVVITVRGKPAARIVPVGNTVPREDAWVVRERIEKEYGTPDYHDPPETEHPETIPFTGEEG